jgi:hypothetical protein
MRGRCFLPLIVILSACVLVLRAQEPYRQLLSEGPLTLFIAYKCKPENRVKLRAHIDNSELTNLAKWKREALLKEYRVLFGRYLDNDNSDMFLLLTFNSYADLSHWKTIERTSPGGLSQETLPLITSATTAALDRIRYASSKPQQPSKKEPVFLIIPYSYSVSTEEYLSYLDGYVLPQLDGWMQEDVLSGYSIYISRYAAGRPWNSLFVLEYGDDEALGKRESTVRKVRSELQKNPRWEALSEQKQSVRTEKEAIIADELVAR